MPSRKLLPKRRSASEWLAENICNEIQRKGLREGDLLTTEAELTTRYGLSRSIVREAVSRLQALGILESRQRKGMLVGRANLVAILRQSIPFAGRTPEELLETAQMRYVLEIGAIELAVCNADEEQLEHLRIMEAEYARAVRAEAEHIAVTFMDAAFHSLLLEMSGNPLVVGMHCVLEEHFRIWREERERRSAEHDDDILAYLDERSVWEHHLIVEAVCRRDVEQARAFLREHLSAWGCRDDVAPAPGATLPPRGAPRVGDS